MRATHEPQARENRGARLRAPDSAASHEAPTRRINDHGHARSVDPRGDSRAVQCTFFIQNVVLCRRGNDGRPTGTCAPAHHHIFAADPALSSCPDGGHRSERRAQDRRDESTARIDAGTQRPPHTPVRQGHAHCMGNLAGERRAEIAALLTGTTAGRGVSSGASPSTVMATMVWPAAAAATLPLVTR